MSDPATPPASPPAPATSSEPPAAAAAAPAGAPAAEKAWYETFADQTLAASPAVQRFKTPEEAAKGYVNAIAKLGKDPDSLIELPKDPADADAMRAVFTRLGLPDTPEGYGLALEGASERDTALLSDFAAKAHASGMLPQHAKAAMAWYVEQQAAAVKAAETAWTDRVNTGVATLKTELGAAYEQTNREVTLFLERYGDEAMREALKPENRGAYPGMVRMIAKAIGAMAEPGTTDTRSGDADTGGARVLSPLQAKAALTTFDADEAKQKALWDAAHPQHKAVLEERRRLLAMSEGREAA